jgi:hypothetical protein
MYVPNGGFKADNSKENASTRVLAAWRANAARDFHFQWRYLATTKIVK